ncbi:hypothetical protein LY78DRAFT_663341 [Colletotrichum sublineola]|nr:hypothetical protein LY78DRAFT_663341 [Colletotrichum sublineola]
MSRHNIACMSVVVLVLFLYSLASVIRQYVRLRHIKGPLSAGFAKWWLVCTVRGGNSHVKFYEAHKKYGMFVICTMIGRTNDNPKAQDLSYVSGRMML